MKLIKSILLGSATGLVAMSGAQAADLPSRKAAPVEYVRVCSAAGVGFFYIPGTDTCLKVGGRVRAEYYYSQSFNRGQDNSGFRGLGRLELDARTQTAYGTLRTFVRLEVAKRTGNAPFGGRSGTQGRYGNAIDSVYAYPQTVYGNTVSSTASGLGGRIQTDVQIDKAFIQWAGITAGRFASFFDFFANDLTWIGVNGSSVGATNGFAYTATFGSGFSATIAVEDAIERRMGFVTNMVSSVGTPSVSQALVVPGGTAIPDIVGNIRVDQAWGSAQISAALHEVRPGYVGGFSNTAIVGDTKYGWAVQGGVKFNLPFIAPGDVFWLQAAYAEGATSYTGAGAFLGSGNPVQGFGGFSNIAIGDAAAIGTVAPFGQLKLIKSYGVTAAFLHYWTPTIRQGVFGSYLKLDVPSQASIYSRTTGANIGFPDWTEWMVGTNLIWSPVRDLDLGVEVMYTKVDPKGRVLDTNRPGRTLSSEDAWGGRLRIQRTF